MTKGAPLGHLFLYAVPLLLGNWLQLAYNAVDSIIAGRFIGQDALALSLIHISGAIMAVPAHDTRDWEFAKKFGLPIIEVVKGTVPSNLDKEAFTDVATGTLVNSDFLNGLSVEDAKNKMYAWLEENGKGHKQVNFKLRDWVFSRQRYCCLLYTSRCV